MDVVQRFTCHLVSPILHPSLKLAKLTVFTECQQSSPRPFASYESAPNDVWSLGVILVNLTCGRNPWKRASIEDSTYSAYLKDRSFLNAILPITDELNAILSMIFDPNPSTRITLPALRQLIADCPKFTTSQQQTVSVVPVLPSIHNIPAHPPSPQLMPYDPGFQHVDMPLCVPHSPPLTPPLCATPVSWTQNIASHSITNFQHGCNDLAGAYSNPASRSPVLPQSHCAIVQPVPTKVHAFPSPYVYNPGFQYWIPPPSRMVSYFQQPFQHHLQQLRPVYAC
jgi:serine/threonine protein kinase